MMWWGRKAVSSAESLCDSRELEVVCSPEKEECYIYLTNPQSGWICLICMWYLLICYEIKMLLHFVYWFFLSWWGGGVYLACLSSIKTTLFIYTLNYLLCHFGVLWEKRGNTGICNKLDSGGIIRTKNGSTLAIRRGKESLKNNDS